MKPSLRLVCCDALMDASDGYILDIVYNVW